MDNISWSGNMKGYLEVNKPLIDRAVKPIKNEVDTSIVLKDLIEKITYIEDSISTLYAITAHKELYDAHVSINAVKNSIKVISKN